MKLKSLTIYVKLRIHTTARKYKKESITILRRLDMQSTDVDITRLMGIHSAVKQNYNYLQGFFYVQNTTISAYPCHLMALLTSVCSPATGTGGDFMKNE